MRLCMGARRGFICRMRIGNIQPDAMSVTHLNRLRQRNSLGPSPDGHSYAVVHCTGYIKNWPPTGKKTLELYACRCKQSPKKNCLRLASCRRQQDVRLGHGSMFILSFLYLASWICCIAWVAISSLVIAPLFSCAEPDFYDLSGVQMERADNDDPGHPPGNCCLVAIGRLQVTSTANSSDLVGSNSTSEFISRHSVDGKFTFIDQR